MCVVILGEATVGCSAAWNAVRSCCFEIFVCIVGVGEATAMLCIAVAFIFLCAQSYWGTQLQAAALRVKQRESRDFNRKKEKVEISIEK